MSERGASRFRSVEQNAFGEETLNGRLIGHFKEPFRQDTRRTQVLRERCESGFELDMFDELVNRGFRVEPQVKCGTYRIDFVVEGREGRRLADRAYLLFEGKILKAGTPQELADDEQVRRLYLGKHFELKRKI